MLPQDLIQIFLCNLSESLTNVISIRLKSLHIPATWYTFDPYVGNTCFYIKYLNPDPSEVTKSPSDASWNKDASCVQSLHTSRKLC